MYYIIGKYTQLYVADEVKDRHYLTHRKQEAKAFRSEDDALTWLQESATRGLVFNVIFIKEKRKVKRGKRRSGGKHG